MSQNLTVMFQLRLIDANRNVLAWSYVPAETRGDGCFWPLQAMVAEGQVTGIATGLNVFWPELNYWLTLPLEVPHHVEAGKVLTFALAGKPLIRVDSEPLPCPSVTVNHNVHLAVAAAKPF